MFALELNIVTNVVLYWKYSPYFLTNITHLLVVYE